tara:strand:+ start:651 stop:947 length:297 start_codon:yes stop_codon:yes gene_type:complete
MSRRYTPGPWEASEGHPSDVWHVDMPNRWYSVIVSRGEDDWDMPVEEVQANARLIAAAPDMLEILRGIVNNAQYYKHGVWTVTWEQIEKAKKKVEEMG